MKYFVDMENVGLAGLAGAEKLEPDDELILFVSDHSATKDVLKALYHVEASVHFRYVSTTAKNAMDFVLVSCIGVSLAKGEDTVCIVSKDHGYEAVRTFWRERGVDIKFAPNVSDGQSRWDEIAGLDFGDLSFDQIAKPVSVEEESQPRKVSVAQNHPAGDAGTMGMWLKKHFPKWKKTERKKVLTALRTSSDDVCYEVLKGISKKKQKEVFDAAVKTGLRKYVE